MTRSTTSSVVAFNLWVGCTGIDDVRLAELDGDPLSEFCEEDTEIESVTFTCGELDITIESGTLAECLEQDWTELGDCPVTVAEFRTCRDAFLAQTNEEFCSEAPIPECEPLESEACLLL